MTEFQKYIQRYLDQIPSDNWLEEMINSGAENFLKERLENQDSEIFVAEENGILTGFTQLYPLFSSTRMKRYWLLNDLFVN